MTNPHGAEHDFESGLPQATCRRCGYKMGELGGPRPCGPHGAEERLRQQQEFGEKYGRRVAADPADIRTVLRTLQQERDRRVELESEDAPASWYDQRLRGLEQALQQERERAGKDCESCEAAGAPCLVHLPKWGADLLARAESAERERDEAYNRGVEYGRAQAQPPESMERDARVLRQVKAKLGDCSLEIRGAKLTLTLSEWIAEAEARQEEA